MLNVTDQYCISPHTNKVGFSCHSGDLSRKCHSCHGSCKSGKGGTRPPSLRYKTVRNTRSLLWSVAGVPSPLLRYCSCVSGFPSFICFNLINGHSCDQNIPQWVCDYFVSQQTELIQSQTSPTSITDLIFKGT